MPTLKLKKLEKLLQISKNFLMIDSVNINVKKISKSKQTI